MVGQKNWISALLKSMKLQRILISKRFMGGLLLRELREDETELLREFLYEAIFIPDGVDPPPREIIEQPELVVYYENFGRGEADYRKKDKIEDIYNIFDIYFIQYFEYTLSIL